MTAWSSSSAAVVVHICLSPPLSLPIFPVHPSLSHHTPLYPQCYTPPMCSHQLKNQFHLPSPSSHFHVKHCGHGYNHKPCNYWKSRGGCLQFNTVIGHWIEMALIMRQTFFFATIIWLMLHLVGKGKLSALDSLLLHRSKGRNRIFSVSWGTKKNTW